LNVSGLEGRVAIVTGTDGGLGGGICSALALACVAVVAVDVERDKTEQVAESVSHDRARCVVFETDISNRSSAEEMARRVAGSLRARTSS
jgi:NAD(P)-dependent dehydrogenase (short-subunit alcohol dehydrogenase family)